MSKKTIFSIFIIAVIALIAIITNPATERHKDEIKSILNKELQSELAHQFEDKENIWSGIGQALGGWLGGAAVDKAVDKIVTVDHYLLFSLTKVNWAEESHIVGIGVFGNVFISKKLKENIRETIMDAMNLSGK